MHLFTHVRAKVALLFAGAFLWGAQAWADTQTISEWDFVANFTSSSDVITYSSSTVKVNNIDCNLGTGYFDGLAFQGPGKWYYYVSEGTTGIYNGNGGAREFVVLNVKADDYIYIGSNLDMSGLTITNGTYQQKDDNVYQFKVTADGNFGVYFDPRYKIISSIKVTREMDGVYVPAPSINIVGVNGESRTVEITGSAASYKYSFDSEATATSEDLIAYDADAKITVSEASTIYAFAYDEAGNASDVVSKEISAGTEVTLAGVTLSGNDGVITFTTDQSSVLCTPTATINYTYTPVDGSAEQSGTVENGGSVTLGYGTISAYASADGYANSATTSGVYAQLDLQLSSTLDFSRSAWGGHTSDLTVTYGEETVETISSVGLTTIAFDGTIVKDFLVKPITSTTNGVTTNTWLKRSVADGLYPQAGTNFAVQNVKAGQVVVIYGSRGNAAFEIGSLSSNIELDVFRTTANSVYTYKCTEDGTVAFSMARYGYLNKIEVYNQVSSIDVAVTSAGYSTFFWDKPATFPSDVTVYTAALSEDKTALNLTEVTGTIPAETAVIVKAEAGTYTFDSAEAVDAISGNALQGTTTELAKSEVSGTVYVLSTSTTNGVGFYKFSGETLAANKAYLVLPAAETAPMVRFNFEEGNVGNVTGIESIDAENGAQARIFDLQGRSLRQAPQKGMYILNGHKVIR
jgi:hypothetical protein